jgi:hypothetical protein
VANNIANSPLLKPFRRFLVGKRQEHVADITRTTPLATRRLVSMEERTVEKSDNQTLSYYEMADKLDHDKGDVSGVVANEMAVASHVFHAIRRGKHGERGYQKVEALKMLHEGTAFLQFDAFSGPQFRLVKLDKNDNITLKWTLRTGDECTLDLVYTYTCTRTRTHTHTHTHTRTHTHTHTHA